MDAYMGFAGIYDLLMDDFNYPEWANYYLELIHEHRPDAKTICECACGTGSITLELAKKGYSLIGVDISQDMLENAAEKARNVGQMIRFVRQDMCRLQLPKPVDALICTCDGVNYLTSEKRVRTFFETVYRQLRPGGVFAFDISSAHKLKKVIGNAFFGEERDDVAYLWQNCLDGDIVNMDITFFVQTENGLYERFQENHRQRAHENDAIANMLTETGFREVRIYGDRNFSAPKDDELRIHFSAVRE